MSVYLVTYDLNKPGQSYDELLGAIKDFPWAKLSESSYAISSHLSAEGVFRKLKPFTDDSDTLYVVTLTVPYAGYGPNAVNEWLDANLGS